MSERETIRILVGWVDRLRASRLNDRAEIGRLERRVRDLEHENATLRRQTRKPDWFTEHHAWWLDQHLADDELADLARDLIPA